MPLTMSDYARFTTEIERRTGGPLACPVCRVQDWGNWAHAMRVLVGASQWGDSQAVALELACRTCGHVLLFAPDLMGVIAAPPASTTTP